MQRHAQVVEHRLSDWATEKYSCPDDVEVLVFDHHQRLQDVVHYHMQLRLCWTKYAISQHAVISRMYQLCMTQFSPFLPL